MLAILRSTHGNPLRNLPERWCEDSSRLRIDCYNCHKTGWRRREGRRGCKCQTVSQGLLEDTCSSSMLTYKTLNLIKTDSLWLGLLGKIWIFHLWSLLLAPSTFLLLAPGLSSEAQAYGGISGREHSSQDVSSLHLITGFFLGRGS